MGSPFHTDAGLHPVAQLDRAPLRYRPHSPIRSERLRLLEAEVRARSLDPETIVPLLAPVLGIGAGAGYEPVPAEGRKLYELIAEAVERYLLACLGGGAGLVVAEDVHWFDPSTLDVLGSLLGAARAGYCWCSPDARWMVTMDGWPVTVFDLTPLSDEQTDALITALNPTVTDDERAAIAGRCDGVPFYIEQVVASLTAGGVPEALYEPLFARLRASANAVTVLEAAAVIGRQVDRGLLRAVVDLTDEEIDDVLDELEDALVLEPWGTEGWRFRHELLREVATELAPPSVRKGLHARVADAMVGGAGGDPDWRLVATHYDQAQRFDEAASAYQQALRRRAGAARWPRRATCLTLALMQLDAAAPGPARDRREIATRLERGFLTMVADGQHDRDSAADFERCLQLGGTDLHDDELFATLNALTGYYAARADLRRFAQVLESLRPGLEGRQWFRPVIEVPFGVMAWLRGEFGAARTHFERATSDLAAADCDQIDAVWFVPSEPIGTAHLHLAWARMVGGDLAGAEAALADAARRADELGFPHGPYMSAYTRFMESWILIETGQFDRAAAVVADLLGRAERHGFDIWQLVGTAQQAVIGSLVALGADDVDPSALTGPIATLSQLVETWRALQVNAYITFFDAGLGRLLIAEGQPEQARARLESGLKLARYTGMCFYDAELLRLRAQTRTDSDARRADLVAALELARRQGATLFEMRAALDLFELCGEVARPALTDVVSRFPIGSGSPELARAEAVLERSSP